ncbi:(5-formylfuran-3-yl)methyl phosphate synthase [Piscinibacter sakaiensis]|nr:(5-formylfuran-3-yl)methyl phosphate synthase [Piscinibacter sakaiensis]
MTAPGRAALQLLVSVRDLAEARAVAAAGIDFVDLKDPSDGALGALPLPLLGAIVQALRAGGTAPRLSATTGDLPPEAREAVRTRALATAAAGVDLVKVGIGPGPAAAACALLDRLAVLPAAIVPVLIADAGIDPAVSAHALALRRHHGCFPALMLDTAGKGRGSLLQRRPTAELRDWVAAVRASGALAGLAGALRADELPALRALGADYAGFRSAVCAGDRAGALDPARLAALLAARSALGTAPGTATATATAASPSPSPDRDPEAVANPAPDPATAARAAGCAA